MKKKMLVNLLMIFALFCVFNNNLIVYAADNCDAILGDPSVDGTFANFLQQIFTVMSYAGPVFCLAMSVFDFIKATGSQDKDALVKATKTTGKRIVLAMLIFFLPTLINFLFPLLGWYGTCGIE